jgi:small-conductance mechanosensitive channel
MRIYIRVIVIFFLVILAEAFVNDTLYYRIMFFILVGFSMELFPSAHRRKYARELSHAASSKTFSWIKGFSAGIAFMPLYFFMENAPFFGKSSIWIEVALFTAIYLELYFLILLSVVRAREAYDKKLPD